MIIHPLTPTLENGELCVSARIELEKPPYDFPKILWFRFPEAHAHLVSDCPDGFAIALLSTALHRGEDIHVRGTLSPALTYGLNEFQYVQNLRKSHRYKPIQIHADGYKRGKSIGSKAASTFSGGIDSFYTVWSHIPQNEPIAGNELSYAIFVQGFDIGLHEQRMFDACRTAYQTLMAEWGIELVTARTNVRQFDKWNNWISAATFATIGLGHIVSRGLSRYYVPANDEYAEYPKGAVATLADALLSSESLLVIEDGAQLTRFEKTALLSHVPAAYNYLRTCSDKHNGLMNCCECGRCLNTMVALELSGALQNFKTFPLPLQRSKLRTSVLAYPNRQLLLGYIQGAL